jgi:hypothetical protein
VSTAFDEVFAQLEAPNYPATCDECGLVGTNESMANHNCEQFAIWPCYIGDHDACVGRSKDGECPCPCGHVEAVKAAVQGKEQG